MTPRIVLLSNSAELRKAVKEALAPLPVRARRVTPKNLPARADAVVTKTALNSTVSWLGMRLGTGLIFVLPEAVTALGEFVSSSRPPAEGASEITLAGNDLAKFDGLERAAARIGEQEVLL